MKKIILILCLIASAQSFAQAKVKKTPEERAKMSTERLTKEITLTKEQEDKIYAINLRAAQKNQEIRKQEGLTEEAKKEQVKQTNLARRQSIQGELTAEQLKILKEKKKAKKQKMEDDDDL